MTTSDMDSTKLPSAVSKQRPCSSSIDVYSILCSFSILAELTQSIYALSKRPRIYLY